MMFFIEKSFDRYYDYMVKPNHDLGEALCIMTLEKQLLQIQFQRRCLSSDILFL